MAQNFFWTPIALYFGKRPVFLFVSFLSFAGSIWCVKANSWHSFEAARVVSALAYSACESLCAGIETDIFFLHERGAWMGIYLVGLLGGVSLGGLMSGFIINALGWRWHFWVLPSPFIVTHCFCRWGQLHLVYVRWPFFFASLKPSSSELPPPPLSLRGKTIQHATGQMKVPSMNRNPS